MKILLASIGTRGDIEPFLALAEILEDRGHDIVLLLPAQLTFLVCAHLKTIPLTEKFLDLLESQEGRDIMGGDISFFKKIMRYFQLFKMSREVNVLLFRQQYDCIMTENPDIIIHHPKCLYPLISRLSHNKKNIMVSPVPYFVHKVDNHPQLGMGRPQFKIWNRWTYSVGNFAISKMVKSLQSTLHLGLNLSYGQINKALLTTPMVYLVSPVLFQGDLTWPSHVKILGYHERQKNIDWVPEDDLLRFLALHDKIVLLTFGSMVNPNPKEVSVLLYNVFDELKIPVIVNTASGGLITVEEYTKKDRFYFTQQIPYDWILDKVYGVVHHGGSGTTHSCVKYGCVSLVVPHIIDQFVWSDILNKKGLAPKGVAIKDIDHSKFKISLADMYNNPDYKTSVIQASQDMNNENFQDELYEFLTKDI